MSEAGDASTGVCGRRGVMVGAGRAGGGVRGVLLPLDELRVCGLGGMAPSLSGLMALTDDWEAWGWAWRKCGGIYAGIVHVQARLNVPGQLAVDIPSI